MRAKHSCFLMLCHRNIAKWKDKAGNQGNVDHLNKVRLYHSGEMQIWRNSNWALIFLPHYYTAYRSKSRELVLFTGGTLDHLNFPIQNDWLIWGIWNRQTMEADNSSLRVIASNFYTKFNTPCNFNPKKDHLA